MKVSIWHIQLPILWMDSANIFGCNINEYRQMTYRIHFCPWNDFTDGISVTVRLVTCKYIKQRQTCSCDLDGMTDKENNNMERIHCLFLRLWSKMMMVSKWPLIYSNSCNHYACIVEFWYSYAQFGKLSLLGYYYWHFHLWEVEILDKLLLPRLAWLIVLIVYISL